MGMEMAEWEWRRPSWNGEGWVGMEKAELVWRRLSWNGEG